jgi:hypothetical protein
MPSFRCNMLDDHGHVLFPADIVAESLAAAIHRASQIRQMSNQSDTPSRRVYAFEVWSDRGREFPEPLVQPADRC